MTTEQFLSQIYRLEMMIKDKIDDIDRFRGIATSITVKSKEVNVQASTDKDKIGVAVAEIVDAQVELAAIVTKYIDRRRTIVSMIDGIENTDDYEVLYDRFVKNISIQKIAEKKGVCDRTVYHRYRHAMGSFEDTYGEKYLNAPCVF